MTKEEKIWDKFTGLEYTKMAEVAENALEDVYIFQCKDFNEGFKRASENMLFTYAKDYKLFASMILECYDAGDFDLSNNNDEWCLLDLARDYINTNYDLLEMVSDYQDEIIEGIKEDDELFSLYTNK